MVSKEISSGKQFAADLVIIGGGGAGLAAATAAVEKGVTNVILLEKQGALGGNSAIASCIFAAESPMQKREGIDASKEILFKKAMRWFHYKTNPRITRAFIDKSGDTIRWLEEKGLSFEMTQMYLNQVPRVIHVLKNGGVEMINNLAEQCRDAGVRFFFHALTRKILREKEGQITGVLVNCEGNEFTIDAKSVIIATGGFGANKELLKKLNPTYSEDFEYRGIPNTGDGLSLASDTGGKIEGSSILLLEGPWVDRSSHWMIDTPEGKLRIPLDSIISEPYTVWINRTGRRFIDESDVPNLLESGNAVARQPESCSFTIFDDTIRQMMEKQGVVKGRGVSRSIWLQRSKLNELKKELNKLAEKGAVKIASSWDEIAAWIGASPEILKATIAEYNNACDQSYDSIFAKERRYLLPLHTPPFYAVKCHVGFLDTIGGIRINENMEILDQQDLPIPGLYAAGVTTAGWACDMYCYDLGGSALGFAINSGRIAGENAVDNASKRSIG
jgi:fumarate reductase flavoprotein subunit